MVAKPDEPQQEPKESKNVEDEKKKDSYASVKTSNGENSTSEPKVVRDKKVAKPEPGRASNISRVNTS